LPGLFSGFVDFLHSIYLFDPYIPDHADSIFGKLKKHRERHQMIESYFNKKRAQGARRRVALSLNLESLEGRVVLAAALSAAAHADILDLVSGRLTVENDISQDRAAIRDSVSSIVDDATQQKATDAEGIEDAEHQETADKADGDADGVADDKYTIGVDKFDYEQASQEERVAQNDGNQSLLQLARDGSYENKVISSDIRDIYHDPSNNANAANVDAVGTVYSIQTDDKASDQSNTYYYKTVDFPDIITGIEIPNQPSTPTLPTTPTLTPVTPPPPTNSSSYTTGTFDEQGYTSAITDINVTVSGSKVSGSAVIENAPTTSTATGNTLIPSGQPDTLNFQSNGTYSITTNVGTTGGGGQYTTTVSGSTLTINLLDSSGNDTGTTVTLM
jgi:hypothetical protein